MITTGILLFGVAAIVALFNMLLIFLTDGEPGLFVIHILCAIASIVALVMVALGVVQNLGWS